MTKKYQPLAFKLRPKAFKDVIGQDHLFGEAGVLSSIENSKNSPSMILWGPAGVGKTTIAKIVAQVTDSNYEMISAVESNSAEIRKKIEQEVKKIEGRQEQRRYYNKAIQEELDKIDQSKIQTPKQKTLAELEKQVRQYISWAKSQGMY